MANPLLTTDRQGQILAGGIIIAAFVLDVVFPGARFAAMLFGTFLLMDGFLLGNRFERFVASLPWNDAARRL